MKNNNDYILIFMFIILFLSCSKEEVIQEMEIPSYNLQVLAEPINSGTISPANGLFKENQNITLVATPKEFYEFKYWSEWNDDTTNPLEIVVKSNVELTAVFNKVDDDEDGVFDENDKCKNTSTGDSVDINGCSVQQKLDDDNDGVINGMDYCSDTPTNTKVNEKGCTIIEDIDGNEYGTIKIGNQVWMSENLKTSKYKDGTNILHITDKKVWADTDKAAYSHYDNDLSLANNYGNLYNWRAANNNICPEGWDIPTKEEWDVLIKYVGGYEIAGEKLKEKGTSHWFSPNEYFATNEYGFSAFGNGKRYGLNIKLQSDSYKRGGYFWTSAEDKTTINNAYAYVIGHHLKSIKQLSFNKNDGHGIRCIKE